MRSAPMIATSTRPRRIVLAAALSACTTCSIPSFRSSQLVSRAPWSSGRVSSAYTRPSRPRWCSSWMIPYAVPQALVASAPVLQCVTTRTLSFVTCARIQSAPCLESWRFAASSSATTCRASSRTVATPAGNVSGRVGDHIAITPSGVDYESLVPEDICVITLDGTQVDGPDNPSTEVPMHTVVYQNTDALAVVHTHPVYATVVGTLLHEVPRIHYMLALLT